jgi:hypothetical protein
MVCDVFRVHQEEGSMAKEPLAQSLAALPAKAVGWENECEPCQRIMRHFADNIFQEVIGMDDIHQRIRRLYAAIGENVETDMNQLPARIVQTEKIIGVIQDFRGHDSTEQLANTLHNLIALVASLEYHLRRWAHHNGHDPDVVSKAFQNSQPLQVVHDLWNVEKHGALQSGRDRSGLAPKLGEVHRVLQLRTQPKAGSSVIMTMGRSGAPVIRGDGSASAVVTADVYDSNGNCIGEAHEFLFQAVDSCETLLRTFGFSL